MNFSLLLLLLFRTCHLKNNIHSLCSEKGFSMDSIKMTCNQVILGVKAARGFGFLSKSFIIEANLNGHTIKTDLLQPSHNITIGAELLWQAEKKVLKRLRIGNVPLKVECFPVANGKKEDRAGFILLTLRAAKTIAPDSTLSDDPGTWHSLLGLKSNVKSYNPSLLLNLYIEDMGMADCCKENTVSISPVSNYEIPLISLPKSITYNGPQQHMTSTFLMSLTLESAGDLHLLAEYPNQSEGIFTLSCDIMGLTKQERKTSELSSLILDINCKFTVKVPGSLENLLDYFQRKDLAVITLRSRGNEIAYCQVNGGYLISEEVLRTFYYEQSFNNILSTRSRYYFTKISTNEIPVSESGLSPFIDTALTLQYLYDDHRAVGQGDAESGNVELSLSEPRSLSTDVNGTLWNDKDAHISYADNGLQPLQQSCNEWFALNFTLESLQVHTASYGNRFYVRLAQARALSVLRQRAPLAAAAGRWAAARGAGAAASLLLLRGSREEVRREVALRRPQVLLLGAAAAAAGEGGEPIAAGDVDAAPLFAGKASCACAVALRGCGGEEVARARGRLSLEEVAVSTPPAESYFVESPRSHSPGLPANDIEHHENFEADFSAEEQPPAPSAVEGAYQMKLQECREASRRMEDDFKLEISRLQTEKKHLLDQIALQDDENAQLVNIKKDLENELRKLKRNSLTESQIAGIMKDLKLAEEKYEIAQRSKVFFKEQWARALREIHDVKAQFRDEVHMRIKYNKAELRNLGRMLPPCEGPRRPASCPAPPPAPAPAPPGPGGDAQAEDAPAAPLALAVAPAPARPAPTKGTSDDLQKSSVEFKLQQLVQQRDCLLNTGTYALDHHLIHVLNKQIRQLLADSTHKFE